ncbi:MAG: Crp/Fnr family transcriptional regulator [Stellaceae bacterium]
MNLPPAAPVCAAENLARKLDRFVPLSPHELVGFQELASGTRTVRRRHDIVTEGMKYRALFLVTDGIMMRYRILRDGRRQIVNLVVPGDFAGVPGCFFDGALYSIKALTDSQIAVIPLSRLFALFDSQPRLAAKLLWSFSCEAAVYAEHLIQIGRRTALERVAHFLLELLTRLQVIGQAEERSYRIPLSQEVIGDALGLSLPYVNRVLRQLADDGLVTVKEHKVVIHDIEGLSGLADFERGYLRPLPISEFADSPRPSTDSKMRGTAAAALGVSQ